MTKDELRARIRQLEAELEAKTQELAEAHVTIAAQDERLESGSTASDVGSAVFDPRPVESAGE